MSSAVSAPGTFDPSTLINSLAPPPAATTTSATEINGVSVQQEFTAMQKNGDLNSLLSDSLAVGVLQFADPTLSSGTDIQNMVNQLIAAYTPGETSSSTTPTSAAALSTNPALALIQTMEASGAFGAGPADSLASTVPGQAAV